MFRSSILVLNTLLLAFPSLGASEPLLRLQVEHGAVVDSAGRTVLLHGVNLGKKGAPFLPDRAEADYAALGRWGMNCVRFYINWAGIEPEPGKYDGTLLAELDQHIGWANAHGLYVLIDLHQDLYSAVVPGGNGAPGWATLDDGKPHVMPEGAPWGVAYATSPKVHQAFDSFWENRTGPGGVGLQERFAAMARHVAARYAGNPGVAGIDLFNEPGLGSGIMKVLPALVDALPALTALPDPPAGLLGLLTNGGVKDVFGKYGARTDIYLWGVEAMTPPLQAFETGKLQPFYDRVGQAVRTVTQDTLLFFEPGVLANSGARSGLRPMQAADGKRLPNQVYAAHVYDLVTDTPYVDRADETRLAIMFDRVGEHARKMGLPVVIGEWGGYYGNARARPAAQSVVAQFEKYLSGDLYWDYESKQESKAYFDQLCRPYPMAVAGILKAMAFNQETRILSVRWTEHTAKAAPTRLYLPHVWFKEKPPLQVTPDSVVTWTEIPGEDAGWRVDIAPLEAGGEREARAGAVVN